MTFALVPPAGKDEPAAASMHIKPKDPKVYVTPAPCDYSPEKAERKVNEASPCFSFGVKADPGKPFEAPGMQSDIRVEILKSLERVLRQLIYLKT